MPDKNLTPEDLKILAYLEANPCEVNELIKQGDVDDIRYLNREGFLFFEIHRCFFFLTWKGVEALRGLGVNRKRLPHLEWKHNQHEMTAEEAIHFFVPNEFKPPSFVSKLVNEKSETNDSPRTLRLAKQATETQTNRKLTPFSVKKTNTP